MQYAGLLAAAGQERLAPALVLVEPARRPGSKSKSSSAPGSSSIRANARGSGEANSRLGEDCVSGASMFSVSDKFRVRVYVARHRAFPAIPARLAARAGRSPTLFFFMSARNTIGTWSSRFRPERSRRFASAKRPSSAGRAGCRRTGQRPTKRSARMRDSTSSAASRSERGRSNAELGRGSNHGRRHQRRIGRRQTQPRRLRGFHSGAAAGQDRGQPQHRARPLDLPASAEGPDRYRLDRRSFQAEPRQTARRRDGGGQRLPQERNRDAGHLQPGRGRARSRAGTTRRCCSARRRSAPAIFWWRCSNRSS